MLFCFLFSLRKWNCQVKALAPVSASVSAETFATRLNIEAVCLSALFTHDWAFSWDEFDYVIWLIGFTDGAALRHSPESLIHSELQDWPYCLYMSQNIRFNPVFSVLKDLEMLFWKYCFISSARIGIGHRHTLISQKSKCLYVIPTISR